MKRIMNRNSNIRKVGDQGKRLHSFDGWKVLVETDPDGIVSEGNTQLTGCIYAAYINLEERTGIVCVNIDIDQEYWPNNNNMIDKPFALLVEPHQVISIIDDRNRTHIGSGIIFRLLPEK